MTRALTGALRATTRRERRAYAAAAAGALTTVGALLRARGLAIKVGSMSQAEIDAMIAAESSELATIECATDEHSHVRGWVVRHEKAPAADPFFWWAGAAGGPDQRFSMRPLRSASGWAKTIKAGIAARDAAVAALLEPEPEGAEP